MGRLTVGGIFWSLFTVPTTEADAVKQGERICFSKEIGSGIGFWSVRRRRVRVQGVNTN